MTAQFHLLGEIDTQKECKQINCMDRTQPRKIIIRKSKIKTPNKYDHQKCQI